MKKFWDNSAGMEKRTAEAAVATQSVMVPRVVPASVSIGGIAIAPATVLAPMAGVTDTVFRRFIRNASVFSGQESGDARRLVEAAEFWLAVT